MDAGATVVEAHQVAVSAEHALLHALPRLTAALVHADPAVARGGRPSRGAAGWKRRSRRLLLTTKTEENAIAAPAIIGLSRPSAASGSAATL